MSYWTYDNYDYLVKQYNDFHRKMTKKIVIAKARARLGLAEKDKDK
jgi:hypothetical protein